MLQSLVPFQIWVLRPQGPKSKHEEESTNSIWIFFSLQRALLYKHTYVTIYVTMELVCMFFCQYVCVFTFKHRPC